MPSPTQRALLDALHRAGGTLAMSGSLPRGREMWSGVDVEIDVAASTRHSVESAGWTEHRRYADRIEIVLTGDGDAARVRRPRVRSRAAERQLRLPW